jgi:hypothetical protein
MNVLRSRLKSIFMQNIDKIITTVYTHNFDKSILSNIIKIIHDPRITKIPIKIIIPNISQSLKSKKQLKKN